MRRRLRLLPATLMLCALLAAPATGASVPGPTPGQVAAAIRTATRSTHLWATINTCRNEIAGVRGQIPALPFPAHLLMVLTLSRYSATAQRYVPVTGLWKLGGEVFSDGALLQQGLNLRWSGPVTLIGHIRFEWFRDGKLLGATTRTTVSGHSDDAGAPRGFSAAACSLS